MQKALLVLSLFATGSIAIAQTTTPAPPQPDRALLILLDVSGSMKESVQGGVKNDLAVRGLLTTLESQTADTVVGLRLMGEGPGDDDCLATRLAIDFAPFATAPWNSALSAVRWNGATPLVHSMRAALADLRRSTATTRELLIIGDGDETCGEDPVGVARAEADGIRIHGISLGEATSHQLAGIALVTGGTYTRAFDDATFEAAAGESLPSATVPVGGMPSANARTGRVEIILDVSNSMRGQVGGRAKMDLAREALTRALADFPADVPIGLRAYGHRIGVDDKAAGCQDTERVIAPASGNAAAIVARANALAPLGHTPIARSLREAGADLAREGGAGVIVLVSDGVESCGGDPEQAARDLRASGLQVVLHTVGLGLGETDALSLQALATAGGGEYFDAKEAADFALGVGDALRSSTEFVLARDRVSAFPTPVTRVSGGVAVADTEILGAGYFSFLDHLFREQRYFAVRGTLGTVVIIRGLVCALGIGRTRTGIVTYQGTTNMMFVERIDTAGERLRGRSLTVRGDMGTWAEMSVEVGADGFARFRIGRPQGAIHRDMLFQVR